MSAPTPFTHTPRPARVTSGHPRQRYFGASDGAAVLGIKNSTHAPTTAVMKVMTFAGDRTAEVETETYVVEGFSASVRIRLHPADLRELARCLIDAAHDIEAGQKGGTPC